MDDDRLTAWLDGELPPDEAAAFAADLQRDPALREAEARLRQVRELVRTAGPARAPTGFADRVLDAVELEGTPRRRLPVQDLLLAAASALVLWTAWPRTAPEPQVAAGPEVEEAPVVGLGQGIVLAPPGWRLTTTASPEAVRGALQAAGARVSAVDGALEAQVDVRRVEEVRTRLAALGRLTPLDVARPVQGRVVVRVEVEPP